MNLKSLLLQKKISCEANVSTATISSIKAGGIADYVISPNNSEEFIYAYKLASEYVNRVMPVGALTNTVFSDAGFRGALISTKNMNACTYVSSGTLYAEAGVMLPFLINSSARKGIRIAPTLSGIPSTVGGAVRNNAGAFDEAIFDTLVAIKVYSPEKDAVFTLNVNDCDFSYRYSIFKREKLFVLGAYIKYSLADSTQIKNDILHFRDIRAKTQPSEPSLGSFFKNPKGTHASYLIDKCGLKGKNVGGAKVSTKHAGFIVNSGNATFKDIKDLSEAVTDEVYLKTGYALSYEAELIN